MSLVYSGAEPQPSLAWTFESSNVDSVTGLAPSAQVSPGPAQLQGSAALVTNAPTSNTAVYFPGTSGNYMNLGAAGPTTFNTTTSNTFVEAWVYFNAVAGFNSRIYGRYFDPTNNGDYNIRTSGAGLGFTNGSVVVSHQTAMQTGVWTHIAFSLMTNGTANVFVNGVVNSTGGSITVAYTPAHITLIGGGPTSLTNAYIRDLRVVQGGVVPVATFTPGSAPFSYASPTYVANMGTTVFTLLGQFITYVPGKYNQGISFTNSTGANTYLATGTLPVTLSNTVGFTCSFWINFNPAIGNNQYPLVLYNGDTSKIAFYFVVTTGLSAFRGDPSGTRTGAAIANMSLVPSASTWYHMALTVTETTWNAYINGAIRPEASGAYTSTNLTNINGPLWIGAFSGNYGLTGLIDDLRIYNTALTSTQVQSVYSSQGAPAPSRAMPLPKLAWDFNGTTTDYVSGITGTTVGSATYNSSGKYGQSLIMNGSSYITYNYPAPITLSTTGATISMWLKTLTLPPSTVSHWLFASYGSAMNNRIYAFYYSDGSVWFYFIDNLGGYIGTSTYLNNPTLGAWSHYAFVLGADNVALYKNGVLMGSYVAKMAGITLDTRFTLAALSSGGGGNINAEYDDLRIFDRSLTSSQVQSIYAAQGMPGRGVLVPQYIKSATGGDTVQTINGYRIHTFTTVGTSTFTPATAGNVEVLVVAGGGGGGYQVSNQSGGGGGAGELIYVSSVSVNGETTVTVGGGGRGGTRTPTIQTSSGGSNSVFGSLAALGGGRGGQAGAGTGGSGGGGGRFNPGGASTATIGLGNAGGSSVGNISLGTASGGGGGGAMSVGQNAYSNEIRTPGGVGYTASISGASVLYAEGGAGGARSGTGNGTDAVANTGSGGGGADGEPASPGVNGGAGGSGIVIVRYPLPVRMTGTPLFSQLSSAATSSAVGAFSLRAVNGTTAKAVQVRPQAQFPPAAMTADTTSLTGYAFGGTGSYVASASLDDVYIDQGFKAFDNNLNTYWHANYPIYTAATGIYLSGNARASITASIYAGEWLQIKMPTPVLLLSYSLVGRSTLETQRSPRKFWILGSNDDGVNWSLVDTQTNINTWASPQVAKTFTISNPGTTYFNTFRIVVNEVGNLTTGGSLQDSVHIATWNLVGSPSSQDFYADRLGNLLTAPVTGQSLANWLGGATGYVATWYDQSGKGNHATQTTAALQPKIDLVNKQIDFKPSAYFNLPNDTVPSGNSNYTMTVRHNTVGTLSCMIGSGTYGTTNGVNALEWNTGEGYNNFWWGNDVKTASLVTNTAGNIVTAKYNNTTGRTIYVNGTSIVTGSNTNRNSTTIQNTIGTDLRSNQSQGANHPMNGELYYVFLFNTALSDTDRTLVESLPIT